MNGLALADQLRVKFHGDRGGDGPMTLGQNNTIQWIGLRPDHLLSSVEWVFQIPETAGIDDVAAAWSVLISRHESLRTTYPPVTGPDGWPVQRVAASGEADIDVCEVDGALDAVAAARALIRVLRERPFELDRELPVRLGVAVTAGAIRAVVALYSHMAVDFGAMAVLGRQFTELAADPVSRVAGPRGHQPLDQAEAERGARGRKRAQAALVYWQDQLRRGPQCMFALPKSALSESLPESGPNVGGLPPTCALISPAVAAALPHITRRNGVGPAVVILAAASAVIAHRTASRYCMLASLAANRGEVRLRDYVGSVAQHCLIVIDTSAAGFDHLIRQAGTASLRAQRHSMYDANELEAIHQSVNRDRGIWFDEDFVYNNLSAHGVYLRSWGLDEVVVSSGNPGSPHETARETRGTLGWWVPRWNSPALVQIDLMAVEPSLDLGMTSGDTRLVPRTEFELLLRGIERLLVAAAADDVDLGQLTQITGVEPVVRDSGWLHIDSCWIELPAAQRLVEDALPGAAPRVFAIPGPLGPPVLTAYLAATPAVRTPGQAHAACMRTLPGRHSAMAPGRYVVCASSPSDPADLTGWRLQPVLGEGDGRTAD
jgi:hypothetical protein